MTLPITPRRRINMGTRFDASNVEKNRNWLDDRSIDELGNLGDDIGYFDERSRGADVGYDKDWSDYQQRYNDLYGAEAPDPGSYEGPSRPDRGSFSFNGPEPGDTPFGSYADYYGRNKGLTGSTDEGDLSPYDKASYYTNNVPDWLKGKLEAGADIGSPDFDAQFAKYSQGAQGQFSRELQRQLESLTGSAAGRGRLNTGFYDEDVGTLAKDLSAQAQDQANQRAVDVLGLQVSDLESRRKSGIARSSSYLDAANMSIGAGKAAQQAAIDRATNARANRSEIRDQYNRDRDQSNTDRTFNEDRYRDRRDTARKWWDTDTTRSDQNFESDRTYGRAAYEDTRNFNQTRYQDSRNARYQMLGDQIDRSLARSKDAYGRTEDSKNRYYDWLSGATDRADARDEARRQRKSDFLNGIIKTGATIGALAL